MIGSLAAGSSRGFGQFGNVDLRFIGSIAWNTAGYTTAGTPVPVQFPVGTQAGDAVIIINGYSGGISTASVTNKTGWTNTAYLNDTLLTYYGTIFTKTTILSDDLSGMTITPPAASTGSTYGTFLTITFRGKVNSFITQLNATIASGLASFSCAGITKAATSKYVLSIVHDRSPSNLTAGADWTQLAQGRDQTATIFSISGSYKTSGSYANGTTIPWTRDATTYSVGNWTIDVT